MEYSSTEEKSQTTCVSYIKTHTSSYKFLISRDLPSILRKIELPNLNALDYGCGTGFSANLLHNIGFNSIGVDIDANMISQAIKQYPGLTFMEINKEQLPFKDSSFGFILSCFVLLEIETRHAIINYLKEASRVLEYGGIFCIITSSDHMYSKNWVDMNNDFFENEHLYSGKKVKVFFPDLDILFTDVYWTMKDIHECIEKTDLKLISTFSPLGKANEPFEWKEEKWISPISILICQKPISE